jgi:hypothetical protein
MKNVLIALIALTLSFSLHAAEGFSSLEEQMTGKEFIAAGLDKLSNEELAALNDWIRRHSLGTLTTPRSAAPAAATTAAAVDEDEGDRRGFAPKVEEEDEGPINSNIMGLFSGWDGQTVFKLENGMIWAQADKDKFYTRDLQNPAVTIEKGFFGSWYMSVEGYNSKCKVRRIQ